VSLTVVRYLRWARELLTRAMATKGPARESLLKGASEALDTAFQFAGGEEYASDSVKQAIQRERERINDLQES
jgi:hypothetical protein